MSEGSLNPVILLIEDDPMVRRLLDQFLRMLVPQCQIVGYAGLENFATAPAWREQPLVAVVLDCYEADNTLRVPQVLQLLEEAGKLPDLPVVLITGSYIPEVLDPITSTYLQNWGRPLPIVEKPATLQNLKDAFSWAGWQP